jgi:hypothetical protein
MAVVNTKSTLVTNYEAQPRILSNPYQAGTNPIVSIATVASGAADSIGSTYRYGFLSSGVALSSVDMLTDGTTAGVFNLGVQTNDNQSLNLSSCVQGWNANAGPAAPYVPGNLVQYNGNTYYCILQPTANQVPTNATYWTLSTTGLIVAPGALPALNCGQCLASAVSIAAAQATWKGIYSPSIGAVGVLAANTLLRVWELLGFIADPFYDFHLVATLTTATTAAGSTALKWSTVR